MVMKLLLRYALHIVSAKIESYFQSKKLYTSLYNSDWLECSQDYKKLMVFAMANMQNELTVRVIGILKFSLGTFVTVRTNYRFVVYK